MADVRAHILNRPFGIQQRLKLIGKIVTVIRLLLEQPLGGTSAIFFTLRAMNDGVLLNLTRAGHQLPEQCLILLA